MSNSSFGRIVIIGGGPGGYEAARTARQLGAEVVLIEESGIGGNAVLTDVVPSKSLIAAAEAAQQIELAKSLGLGFSHEGEKINPHVEVDLGAMNVRLLSLAANQSEQMRSTLIKEGVEIIEQKPSSMAIITFCLIKLASKSDWKQKLSLSQLEHHPGSYPMPRPTEREF